MWKNSIAYFSILLFCFGVSQAQIQGVVSDSASQAPLHKVELLVIESGLNTFTSKKGTFTLVAKPTENIIVFKEGFRSLTISAKQLAENPSITLSAIQVSIDEILITENSEAEFGMMHMKQVEGTSIYAAKKTEVILPSALPGNKAVNQARQTFGKVPGLNIWESDGGGLQLGIGARGLSPDRTSNFNVRQNGYDIAADALGYPESYYTPPTEAIERIELVRGAASLQYGTQFGGVLNFKMNRGPKDKPFSFQVRETLGSFGLWNSFVSLGGQNKDWNYYGFYQRKQGNGWRANSGFESNTVFVGNEYKLSEKWTMRFDFTHMDYLAQQPGGLTDQAFYDDPQQSVRSRNWFQVKWNVAALTADYSHSNTLRFNTKFFGLMASREALGNLDRIDRVDITDKNRTLIRGAYQNYGNETRMLKTYDFLENTSNLLVGVRLYKGNTISQQGDADNTAEPNFEFLNPNDLEGSDYNFPSTNVSLFTENVFRFTERLSVTPGLRYEYIHTGAEGWYKQVVRNLAGDVIVSKTNEESRDLYRSFVLGGLGVGYKFAGSELYANASQNYRAITFNDIRIDNPNFIVDPEISDETGANIDLGWRGGKPKVYRFDLSAYYLAYNNRIGFLTVVDSVTFIEKRLKTNIGDSKTFGIEAYVEYNVLAWVDSSQAALNAFVNLSLTHAKYTQSDDALVEGKSVELVPPVTLRTGLSYCRNNIKAVWQLNYIADQYTDAYNTETPSPNAVTGVIPSYLIQDLSVSYTWKKWCVESGVNNLFNAAYFTRRATGYPGPGVIPADARNFYFTLGFTY